MLNQPAKLDSSSRPWQRFAPLAALVVLAFALPLWHLLNFALHDELCSYVLLIPFISGYLIGQDKARLPVTSRPAPRLAAFFFVAGLAMLAWHQFFPPLMMEDSLAQTTLAFLFFLTAAASWSLGWELLRAITFPYAFLIFFVPLPLVIRGIIESGLQQGSACVAGVLFVISNTPVAQDGLLFSLPGIRLEVAPECSGIHSTIVLFITSLLAGHYFLNRPWKRWVICLAIIPLALLRNGFRIYVIGELCVHIGPQMINSVIHRHGGPLFFLLSLIPFFYLIKYLRKGDRLEMKPAEPKKNLSN